MNVFRCHGDGCLHNVEDKCASFLLTSMLYLRIAVRHNIKVQKMSNLISDDFMRLTIRHDEESLSIRPSVDYAIG